jgi:protein-L-isoaspartate(D-aspartate) O-methyltransferase
MAPIAREYKELIDDLVRDGCLKTPLIIEAFKNVDRADFVPAVSKNLAYINEPLPIGFGQTISQPLTVAFMIELLAPQPGEKILDVGAGSGWQASIISYIVGKESKIENIKPGIVVAVERLPAIKLLATANCSKYDFIKKGALKIIAGDASKGVRDEAPFDRIIAAAASSDNIPVAWKTEVKIGGRIVAPVGDCIEVLDKINANDFNVKIYQGFRFVPLVSGDGGG